VLDATTTAATGYLWSTGATLPAITVSTPGFYQVTVTAGGCTGTDTITIGAIQGLGSLTLPAALTVCEGDSAILDATTTGAATYLWSAGAATPTITVKTDGTYYVTVSNSCGALTDSTVISVIDCKCRIYMPNAFTPNDDGTNDFYGPEFKCADPKYMLMRIFNRWGEKVFETTEISMGSGTAATKAHFRSRAYMFTMSSLSATKMASHETSNW
jgi:gliding motility-associated-like protein